MQLLILCLIAIYITLYMYPELVVGQSWFVPVGIVIYIIVNCLYLWKYKWQQLFCFELFFAISFFLCCFLTPLIYESLDAYHKSFFYVSNFSVVKVYLISTIGYLMYLIGLTIKNSGQQQIIRFNYSIQAKKISNWICFSLIFIFYALGGIQLINLYNADVAGMENRFQGWGGALFFAMYAYIVSIVVNFSSTSIYRNSTVKFIKSLPTLFIINTILLVIPLLISGLRSSALQLIIPLILMYSISVKRITAKKMVFLLMLGFVLMVFIGFNRTESQSLIKQDNLVYYFRDFFYANSGESYLIDYADKHGPTGGSNMLMHILSIVPFLQSFTAAIIDTSILQPASSTLYTDAYNTGTGLGTNLIGDIYYTFHFIGVLILMFIYGLFLKKCNSYKTPYGLVLLLAFTGNALFAPRVEFAYVIRTLSYCAIILYIINHLSKRPYSSIINR